MDTTTAVPTAGQAQALPFDKMMTVRERLGDCLTALLEKGGGTQSVDPELLHDLRLAASLLTTEEIGMAADAMIGVAMHEGYLQPASRSHDEPRAGYRLLGALLGGLDSGRAISTALRVRKTAGSMMEVAGGMQDREEHVLAGLLGSLDGAAPSVYEWLASELRALPAADPATPRLSASALPWLINRVVRMPAEVAGAAFEAALSRCKTLPATDHVALWLACAAPCGGGRDLIERTDDGARLKPGVLIEDEDLPLPAAIRELEREVNLLLALSLPAPDGDAAKKAALRQLSPHLSGADLEICTAVLAQKSASMLGALFSGRSAKEAGVLSQYLGSAADAASACAVLRTIVENLGDTQVAVYEPFLQELARLGGTAAVELALDPGAPQGARDLIDQVLRAPTH